MDVMDDVKSLDVALWDSLTVRSVVLRWLWFAAGASVAYLVGSFLIPAIVFSWWLLLSLFLWLAGGLAAEWLAGHVYDWLARRGRTR